LEDDSEVFYQMGNYYTPGDAAGLRFDDPKLEIEWPLPVSSISEKDLAWPLLQS
jgi:dTDP-4-dehydrorhamnose 3,5-epimerase